MSPKQIRPLVGLAIVCGVSAFGGGGAPAQTTNRAAVGCPSMAEAQSMTLEQLREACGLKTSPPSPSEESGSAGTAAPTPAPTIATPTLIVRMIQDVDFYGHDIGGQPGWLRNVSTPESCKESCLANRSCVAFTYNFSRSVCILKDYVDTARLYNPGEPTVMGIVEGRIAAAPSEPAVHVHRYDNVDFYGHDIGGQRGWIRRIKSADDCERLCLSLPDRRCAGYTYNVNRAVCILKDYVDKSRLYDPGERTVLGIVDEGN